LCDIRIVDLTRRCKLLVLPFIPIKCDCTVHIWRSSDTVELRDLDFWTVGPKVNQNQGSSDYHLYQIWWPQLQLLWLIARKKCSYLRCYDKLYYFRPPRNALIHSK